MSNYVAGLGIIHPGLLWICWFIASGILTCLAVVIFRHKIKSDVGYVIASMTTLALCVFSWGASLRWIGTW